MPPATHSLKRVLGPIDLVTLGIGAIIGTGIFVLTGQAAAAHAGPAIVLSMVLAGFASALAGLCYAEFASTVPIAGSAYTYGYATLGEFVAWIIGWDLILEYALGAATVAVGWSGYVVSFLHDVGIQFPAQFSAAPGTLVKLADGSAVTAVFNLPAVIITVLVTALLVVGIQESARVNAVIVIVKVAVVLLVIVRGRVRSSTAPTGRRSSRRTPASSAQYGWSGILRGAGVIFFAYIGFDAVSTAAQEARNPQKDMPIGILGSLVVCTILYVLVSGVMVGLVPYTQLGVPAPMAVAIDAAKAQAVGSALVRLVERHAVHREARGHRRPELGHGRDDARPAAHLLCDGEGRAAAGMGEADPPAIPHAAHHHHHHRRRRGDCRRASRRSTSSASS